jgi:hypothetical protein
MTNNMALTMDHEPSMERNPAVHYGSYGGHGPMPPTGSAYNNGSSSNGNLQSFEPYGIIGNNSPHHHHYGSEQQQQQHQQQQYGHNQQQQQQYPPQYVVSTTNTGPSYPYAVTSGSHHGMSPFGTAHYGSPSWGGPHLHSQPFQPLQPLIPVEYITNIQSSDVLCGRGGATNSHSGNRSFRSLVKRHQDKYLKAKKRDKPGVAACIVDLIRSRGGRFLRRHDDHCSSGGGGGGGPHHHVLWVDIGNERAREKTCQALREGAPELRRRRSRGASSESSEEDDDDRASLRQKRKVSSFSENDGEKSGKSLQKQQPIKCEQSLLKRSHEADDDMGDNDVDDAERAKGVVTMTDSDVRDDVECVQEDKDVPQAVLEEDGPLMICPCPLLMRRPVIAIPISDLSPRDQELYLNDFMPPHSNIRTVNHSSGGSGSSTRQVVLMARDYTSVCSDHDDDDDDDNDDDDTENASECWEV